MFSLIVAALTAPENRSEDEEIARRARKPRPESIWSEVRTQPADGPA